MRWWPWLVVVMLATGCDISDPDGPNTAAWPKIAFEPGATFVDEGPGYVDVAVHLSFASDDPVRVLTQFAGTARFGADYTSPTDAVELAPGETYGSVQVAIIADSETEVLETIEISLLFPRNAQLGVYRHDLWIRAN